MRFRNAHWPWRMRQGLRTWAAPERPLAVIAAGFAAGCAFIVKPAELTPLSALALGVLALLFAWGWLFLRSYYRGGFGLEADQLDVRVEVELKGQRAELGWKAGRRPSSKM